jgi:hypothetical protein
LQKCVIDAEIHWRHGDVGRLQQWRGLAEQRAHGLLTQWPLLVEQLLQRLFDAAFAFLGSQIEQMHILLIRTSRLLRQQRVVSASVSQCRIEIFPVHVAGKRPGLAHQPADDVPVVDPVLVLAAQTWHALHELLGIPDLDLGHADPHLDVLADQPRRHRVRVVFHPDGTASPDAHPLALERLQTPFR